jgi:hypothetical protein
MFFIYKLKLLKLEFLVTAFKIYRILPGLNLLYIKPNPNPAQYRYTGTLLTGLNTASGICFGFVFRVGSESAL